MKIHSTLLLVIIALSPLITKAQQLDDNITISEADPRIEVLAKRYNKTHECRGYRIQIVSSSKKDQAKKVKSQFASQYRNVPTHETYQAPFFIIKVGDFLTKLEAEKFHRQIMEEYPGSFILPDEIEPFKHYTNSQN